jgi:hypothetical protein
MRQRCPCPVHTRIRTHELAEACEARAGTLWDEKQFLAATEVIRCADAIRRVA